MRSRLVAAGKRYENNADMKYAPRWLSTGNQSGPRPQGQRPCRQNDVRPLIGRCIRGPHQISCRAIRGRVGTRRRPIRRRCADCKCKKNNGCERVTTDCFFFSFAHPTGVSSSRRHVHRVGRHGAPEQVDARRPATVGGPVPPMDVRRPSRQIHSRVSDTTFFFSYFFFSSFTQNGLSFFFVFTDFFCRV